MADHLRTLPPANCPHDRPLTAACAACGVPVLRIWAPPGEVGTAALEAVIAELRDRKDD